MTNIISKKKIPMFLPVHALTSLRDSGFNLAGALAEPIDNSLEAKANNVGIYLNESVNKSDKKHVHRILITDDGEGMDEDVLHHYLQIGYSTRYMRTDTIGKYGVGAKLAALNFATRIDVWSRQDKQAVFRHVYFDLVEMQAQEEQDDPVEIEAPNEVPLPEDIAAQIPNDVATVVVWSGIDRLEEGRVAHDTTALKSEIQKELSRIFRYFLNEGINIAVNGTQLLPHDPLFLMERTWADKVLSERSGRGKEGTDRARHFAATKIHQSEDIKINGAKVRVTITLYPNEAIRTRGQGNDELAQKLRIPENQGCISFVRHDREINYTNVPRIFPRGVEDADRYIGIEVAFNPELDHQFGVRNVKRGVEPHEGLRAELLKLLKRYIPEARAKLDEIWGEKQKANGQNRTEHAPILEATKNANRTMPKARAKDIGDETEKQRLLDDLARDVVGNDEKAKAEYLEGIKELPFVIESIDYPGPTFVEVQHVDGQVVIRLNTRHRFYREMWEPIKSIAQRSGGSVSGDEAVRTARRTIEAMTLLLIAYGKAQSMHEHPREQYGELTNYWGQFAESLLGKVKNVF